MFNIFKRSPNGNKRQQNTKLMGMRNYCAAYYDPATGKLNFWIQAEVKVGVKGTMGYLLDVPKLVFGPRGGLIHHLAQSAPVLPLSPSAVRESSSSSNPPGPSYKDRPVPPPPMPPRPESNYPAPPSYPPPSGTANSSGSPYGPPGVGGFTLPSQQQQSHFGGGFVRPPSY
jgi:hypothetical protein